MSEPTKDNDSGSSAPSGWLASRRARRAKRQHRDWLDLSVCSWCGYSLDGSDPWWEPEARCPECGCGIFLARLGSDLPLDDPERLRLLGVGLKRVARSIWILYFGTLWAPLAVMLLTFFIEGVLGVSFRDRPWAIALYLGLAAAIVVTAAAGWGLGWRAVRRASAGIRCTKPFRFTRFALTGSLWISILVPMGLILLALPGLSDEWARWIVLALVIGLPLAIFATAFAGASLMRELGSRVGNAGFVSSFGMLKPCLTAALISLWWVIAGLLEIVPGVELASFLLLLLATGCVFYLCNRASELSRVARFAAGIAETEPDRLAAFARTIRSEPVKGAKNVPDQSGVDEARSPRG